MTVSLTRQTPLEASSRQQELLQAYECLLTCSARMLNAAREADWEALIALQGRYLEQMETLRGLDDEQMILDQEVNNRKIELLEQLVEQDQEIRKRLMERREALTQMILGSRHQLALSRTYSFYQGTSEVIEAAQRFTST
ncbi:MAG: flagellar protein FliT [Lamprobacter sp.]|uniref:flagellar protein FliT n=1 Tax=Lamprobacter sp. TaxID=3100796 RepID=UPI002B25DFFE|nr:flagellar protein FliT [Lamprobacter sp.]MEA3639765.1 flagellar protein FliT [Lamprobacter sp.]